MKKLLTILSIVFFVGQTWAQTTEFLQQKDFKLEKQKIFEGINATKKQLNEIKKSDLKMEQSIDSLKQIIGYYTGQLVMTTDSLSKTSVKLNALQEKVDNEKFLSKGMLILFIVIILLLFIILFVMLLLFKKKAELNHDSLVEQGKKTNEQIEIEKKNLKNDIQSCNDLIGSNSNEMNQRISTGLSSIETRNHQMEQQLQENLGRIGSRIDIIGPEISKLKEELSNGIKNIEDKLNAVKREVDQSNQVVAAQTAKLEEEFRILKGKH